MRLIYLTAKRYPGSTADHHYIKNLAQAFYQELGDKFTFIACNTKKQDLLGINLLSVHVPFFVKRTIVFFFWLPWYWFSTFKITNKEEIIFFSNDFNLLTILIFWKSILKLPMKIVSDWHLITHTWKDKFVASRSDISITTSKKLESAINNINNRTKSHTIYGGINLDFYKHIENKLNKREELGLPRDKFLVGYVGLFTTMGMPKGISTMIDSLPYPNADVVMVFVGGKNNEISQYKTYAKNKGVLSQCIFLPVQSFDKVAIYEMIMDTLVIPYPDKPHFREYGFPMKIYEYMASKVPIIYTKLELVEEVAKDCAYGVMPDSPKELANKILFIKNNPLDAKKLSDNAYNDVLHYSWTEKAKSIINIILI